MRTETFSTPEPPSLRINLPSGDVRIETGESAETRVSKAFPSRLEYRRTRPSSRVA